MSLQTRTTEIASALTTGNKARVALGEALVMLNGAYQSVANYNPMGMDTTGFGQDSVTQSGREYLDGIRLRAEADFALLPATDDALPLSLARQVGFDIASIEHATGIVGSLGTAVGDLVDAVRENVPDLPTVGWSLLGLAAVAVIVLILLKR